MGIEGAKESAKAFVWYTLDHSEISETKLTAWRHCDQNSENHSKLDDHYKYNHGDSKHILADKELSYIMKNIVGGLKKHSKLFFY